MISAETGKGKTMLCIGIAYAAHLGRPFLHWKAGRPSRVLHIDGEMPRDLMWGSLRGLHLAGPAAAGYSLT
jgi:RecA-family ATPase